MKSVTFSNNEIKVYQNSCIKIKQETLLQSFNHEFKEICCLIELFNKGEEENFEKIDRMGKKLENYTLYFEGKIKELNRLLRNTNNRIKYNIERCI